MIAVVGLASVSCGGDDFEKNAEGFNIEPADQPGPHAFTVSVAKEDVKSALGVAPDDGESAQAGGGTGACDNKKYLEELQKRPEAYKEWGRVLGIPQSEIPAYIQGLESTVLSSDTKVTNHGLKDGKAYPRASVLKSGTAVFVDKKGRRPKGTTTTELTGGTVPSGAVIVTRCKCGNPLLPPPADPKTLPSEVPGTEPPGTEPAESGTTTPSSRGTTTSRGSTTTRATTTSSASSPGGTGPVVR